MREVAVWRGRFGDPVPLVGPLSGLRDGDTLAYEFQLPERFTPRPGHGRLERTYVLLDLGVSFALPRWATVDTPDAGVVDGIDAGLAVASTWYVDLVQVDDTARGVVVRDLYVDVMVPVDGRHQRLLDLDEFADAIEDGTLPVPDAIDGLRRWQQFLDRHLMRPATQSPTGRTSRPRGSRSWPPFPHRSDRRSRFREPLTDVRRGALRPRRRLVAGW